MRNILKKIRQITGKRKEMQKYSEVITTILLSNNSKFVFHITNLGIVTSEALTLQHITTTDYI